MRDEALDNQARPPRERLENRFRRFGMRKINTNTLSDMDDGFPIPKLPAPEQTRGAALSRDCTAEFKVGSEKEKQARNRARLASDGGAGVREA